MIRLIIKTMDGSFAANLGGPGTPAEISYKTFDIDAPEIEKYLKQPIAENWSVASRAVIGAEVL